MQPQKTKLEIIDETIAIYADESMRSYAAVKIKGTLNNQLKTCAYAGQNGCVCAYARVVKHEFRHLLVEGKSASQQHNDEWLFDEYKGHDEKFWREVQVIHDNYDDMYDSGTGIIRKIDHIRSMYLNQ